MTPLEAHLFCHRCGRQLHPGQGDFYFIKILAVADPTPPVLDRDDPDFDAEEEIRQALEELENVSEQEAMDQVFRRLTLHLCNGCYGSWIENPAG
jgi:hypothetical protein